MDTRAPQGASTLELFFDLVFVFALTQVSAFLVEHGDVAGLARGALLLAMLWWMWSTFTWTTNWTGTETAAIRLSLLAAMGVSLAMAQAVPDAFEDGGAWFAVTYFIVRLISVSLSWLGAAANQAQREALLTFLPLATMAPLLVLVGGFLDSPWRTVLWVLAFAVDLVSALSAGRGTWQIQARHFAERNGLFVIIALGESIVAIGLGVVGEERSTTLALSLGVVFVGAAALWWSYFDRPAQDAERYLAEADDKEQGRFARDAYSILHYPIILGIVLYAVAAEEVVAHPDDALDGFNRFAISVGVALVLLAVVAAAYRAVRRVPTERFVAAVVLIGLALFGGELSALRLAALVDVVLIASLVIEHRNRARLDAERSSTI